MPIDIDKIYLKLLYVLDQAALRKQDAAEHVPRSVQAVGQRIQQLHDAGLVESKIDRSEDGYSGDLFIVYETSDAGRQKLDEYLVCVDVGCLMVKPRSDHQHAFMAAADYFDTDQRWK